MKRYVLQYRGSETPPDSHLDHIRSLPGLKVVDAASANLYLVEATDAAVRRLQEMPSWVVSPETQVPVPDTRKKIRQSV
jgi:hypothetical protein